MVTVFVLLGGLISGYSTFKQSKLLRKQTKIKNEIIRKQARLIQETKKGSNIYLLSNVLNEISEDLKTNPQRKLSVNSISSIKDVSHALEPFQYLDGDSISDRKFSPGRGQLLVALKNLKINPTSFAKLRSITTFSFADLQKANLRKINLRKADFRKSYFKEANLKRADLDSIDLRDAVLWGANLQEADLKFADLQRADFSWSNLNGASLSYSNLNDIIMKSARLKKADMSYANARVGNFDGALFVGANLYKTDLAGTSLVKASFTNANLRETKLKYCDLSYADLSYADLRNSNLVAVNLTDAIMVGTQLDGLLVDDKDWFGKLEAWKVVGVNEIKTKYQVVQDENQPSSFKVKKRNSN